MTETINGRTVLTTPFSDEDIRALRTGDVIFINGDVFTGRDDVHIRVVAEDMELPSDISGKVLMHAGPIVAGSAEEGYKMIAVGPTTSMRMEKFEYDFIKKTGVKLLIGKGAMGSSTAEACREFGAVHCVLPAGNAVVTAARVKEITGCGWADLGMAEAFWSLRVNEFGPLTVTIDSNGNNLFEEKKKEYNRLKEEQIGSINRKLNSIL